MRRLLTITLAIASVALLSVTLLAARGDNGRDERTVGADATPTATECDEAAVREAIRNADAVRPDIEFEFLHLACADGFGWAVIDPVDPRFDEADVLLRVSDAGIEVLDIGTSVCTLDFGIPPDVAAKIAPPGRDPAGDCPEAVEAEPRFTG